MTLEDIQQAIACLTANLLPKLRAWLDAFEAERFDRKIAHDARSGRLDPLADEAVAEFRARKPLT